MRDDSGSIPNFNEFLKKKKVPRIQKMHTIWNICLSKSHGLWKKKSFRYVGNLTRQGNESLSLQVSWTPWLVEMFLISLKIKCNQNAFMKN